MDSRERNTYWKSLARRDDGSIPLPVAGDEFPDRPDPNRSALSRRDFLAAAGFTFGSVALTGCNRTPVEMAIPYLVQPEAIIPGRATHYATTCTACSAACGVIAKNRDGRIIKLEGNPDHPRSSGGLCAIGQASVLGLYDIKRLQAPQRDGAKSSWPAIDSEIATRLNAIRNDGGTVRFLTPPVTSPTRHRLIRRFLDTFADGKHVTYDTLSTSAIHQAHQRTHGRRVLPRYLFDRADVIVGFDADFLGTWISPVAFTAAWSRGRNPEADPPRFSHHTQFEGRVSITGAKADHRVSVSPQESDLVIAHLATMLAHRARASFSIPNLAPCAIAPHVLEQLVDRLWNARGQSLVVCGSQDVDAQAVCNFINHVLGNYGQTLDIERPAAEHDDGDEAVQTLLEELATGSVDALFLHDVDPVYDLPNGSEFAASLKQVPLIISLDAQLNETSAHANYACPDHHYLESWGDVDSGAGLVSFLQPTMRPMFNTRSAIESIAIWSGSTKPARDLIRETWGAKIRWAQSIHDGFAQTDTPRPTSTTRSPSLNSMPVLASSFARSVDPSAPLLLTLYPKIAIRDGRHASNPWLQEMPDPITKVVWDNYVSLSETTARRLGLRQDDVARIKLAGGDASTSSIELPVLIQPGQHDQVVAIALGYGRSDTARFAGVGPEWLEMNPNLGENGLVGTSAAALLTYHNGTLRLSGQSVSIEPTGRRHELACTQDYHNIEAPEHLTVFGMNRRRPLIREGTAGAYRENGVLPVDGHAAHHEPVGELWPDDHKYTGYHWGMAIDLTACTGCSGCVVACQIENNVPVVGRDEVRRKRIMHWLRIDRYYCDNDSQLDVAHQPVMCQHCDNAPCETVCPVLATTHSEEGLNQQTYNRCVGTRYCANNCPYKVRRFNWFEYAHDDRLANMSLNPDITVRSQGVMEKCSFCIQRIELARIDAKREGRSIADGDIQPACQQSCPAGAIVFGDMNDPESAVSKLIQSGRHYRLLEETNVKPSVGYLGLIRNRNEDKDRTHHG